MKRIIFITMLTACTITAQAQFSGQGSGTEKDPYQITNGDQLFDVRNDLTAHYKVMNDIDLGAWIEEDNPQNGWNPIGNATTPFRGSFNGNGHSIKNLRISRSGSDAVGLFGCVVEATIQRVCLVNVNIEGGQNVGAITGRILEDIGTIPSRISDNIIVGGKIAGQNAIGGIVGSVLFIKSVDRDYPRYTHNITGNVVMAEIEGSSKIGGICGVIDGGRNSYYDCTRICVNVTDNEYIGSLTGTNSIGGIVGAVEDCQQGLYSNKFYETLESWSTIYRNVSQGSIIGESLIGGIVGSYVSGADGESVLRNNTCAADTLIANSGVCYRITNLEWPNNYASAVSVVFNNGRQVSVEDDNYNGTSYGIRTLKRQSTYEGLGFDFTKQWAIVEGSTFPYNISQCEPASINSFVAGSKSTISGTAKGNGTVYVFVGGVMKEAPIVDGSWELNLGNLRKGSEAKVSVQCSDKAPSVFVTAKAEAAPAPPANVGDANGDGTVDAADVTAIINFILGKPSSSFNRTNADINGDGQILIDDAVQTVQIIMDAQ